MRNFATLPLVVLMDRRVVPAAGFFTQRAVLVSRTAPRQWSQRPGANSRCSPGLQDQRLPWHRLARRRREISWRRFVEQSLKHVAIVRDLSGSGTSNFSLVAVLLPINRTQNANKTLLNSASTAAPFMNARSLVLGAQDIKCKYLVSGGKLARV